MKASFLLLVSVSISACATTPVETERTRNVPESRIFDKELSLSKPDKAELVLVRDAGFGGQCALAVYLDGKQIGEIEKEEKITVYVTPGRHILGAGPNPNGAGVCKIGAGSLRREVEVSPQLGVQSKYRLAMLKGEVEIMPTGF